MPAENSVPTNGTPVYVMKLDDYRMLMQHIQTGESRYAYSRVIVQTLEEKGVMMNLPREAEEQLWPKGPEDRSLRIHSDEMGEPAESKPNREGTKKSPGPS